MQNHKNISTATMKKNAAKAQALLRELANTHRLLILCYLISGEKSVNELAKSLGLSQSALSQHLARLREAGLAQSDKRGQMVYYRIASMEAQALLLMLNFMYCK